MTNKTIGSVFLFFLCIANSYSQTIVSRVLDKKTNAPIPYATIQLSENQGIITNEEGRFTTNIDANQSQIDSIYITSMGYEKIGIALMIKNEYSWSM